MHWRHAAFCVLAAGTLAGCETTGPDRVETTHPTVSYQFDGDDELETAAERADAYCEGYGLNASLADTDQREDSDDVATFECD